MVARLLEDSGLPSPELEYPILAEGGRRIAQVDLAYPSARIAIELDSVRWHLDRRSFHRDRDRWNALTSAGWTPLLFTWAMYADTPTDLVATVRATFDRKSAR